MLTRSPGTVARWLAVIAAGAACGVAREIPDQLDWCQHCHGGESGNAAPPLSTRGGRDTRDPRVGAHQAHVRGGALRGPIACSECHVVPSDLGHIDRDSSPVFGPLALARDATPAFARATGTCTGTYCHGAKLKWPGTLTAPAWTTVDGTQAECGTCHGIPPPPPHPASASCRLCHPQTVLADGRIDVAGGFHVNGALDGGGGACGACHAIPPATGAHRAHYGDTTSPPLAEYGDLRILEGFRPEGGPAYAFGCGHCHPLDVTHHGRGEVVLSPDGAPAGTLKARNAADAAYDAGTGTCSGVYCHSNGKDAVVRVRTAPGVIEDVPPFRTTPPWTSTAGLGCDGCHDNPPRYESGGVGAPDANTHLQLASDGYETGHFAGLPGPWHWVTGPKHGWSVWGSPQQASPITCQTCHYETTDPAATGPSGFYWLNTTGNYLLPDGPLAYACADCHAAGNAIAPLGAGGVLPLRHVNGRADVTFDPRIALPPYASLPPAPFTPSRPIFVTDAFISVIGPDAVLEPETVPSGGPYDQPTLSMHLGSAMYAPATKTCSLVSCHVTQSTVRWGGPTGEDSCSAGACHPYP